MTIRSPRTSKATPRRRPGNARGARRRFPQGSSPSTAPPFRPTFTVFTTTTLQPGSGDVTITVPAGGTSDVAICTWEDGNGPSSVNTPGVSAGWTMLTSQNLGLGTTTSAAWYKTYTTAGSDTFTVSGAAAGFVDGVLSCVRISGVDTTTPIVDIASLTTTVGSTIVTTAYEIAEGSLSLLVGVNDFTNQTWTGPAGWTEVSDSLAHAYYLSPTVTRGSTVGASGPTAIAAQTLTASNTNTVKFAYRYEIQPLRQAGGAVAVAATIPASAGVTAALAVDRPLAATPAAVSTVTAALSVDRPLAATPAAVSTVTAALTVTKDLAATIAGTATVTAAVTLQTAVAATVTAATTVAGTVTEQLAVASTPTAVSTVTAALAVARPLAATITGAATVTAALSLALPAAATITATATVSGTVTEQLAVTASPAGAATVTAALSVARPLAVTIPATATVTADVTEQLALAATITAASTVTADLTLAGQAALAATITAAATVAGTIVEQLAVAATPAGAATVTADIAVARPLAATPAATAAVTAALSADRAAATTATAAATVTADLTVTAGVVQLAATITAAATVAATATVDLAPSTIRPARPGDFGGYGALLTAAITERRTQQTARPEACPHDGTPLDELDGILNCPMGDFRWPPLEEPEPHRPARDWGGYGALQTAAAAERAAPQPDLTDPAFPDWQPVGML